MSMRINESDVRVKLDYVNELLASVESSLRVKFSFRYNYYVLEEMDKDTDLPTGFGVLCAGSKRECYNYLCAMLRGIDLYSFKR